MIPNEWIEYKKGKLREEVKGQVYIQSEQALISNWDLDAKV